MNEEHITIKLTLSPLPDGRYRSRIEDSPVGASQGFGADFDLPEEPVGGYAQFLQKVDKGEVPIVDLLKLGKQLYARVFAGNVYSAFERVRGLAQNRGAFLRLAISALSPELVRIPWEFLHDGNNYLIKHPMTHIVRVLDELPPQMAPFRPFRRLLLAVANPKGKQRFDSDKHLDKMRELLTEMGATVIIVSSATRMKLMKAIEEEDFDAFYFLGHGEFDTNDGGRIFLEDKDGNAEALPAYTLAEWFGYWRKTIYFAYFNSCFTGTTGGDNTFAGVAQRILADGRIPAVVGQQAPILASRSMTVVEAFLRSVRRGDSPETAIIRARSSAASVTWGIPVLYTHVRGAEEFERNRIECLLDADRNTKFVLSLPTFRMGVLRKDFLEHGIKVKVEPADSYKYAGDTHPLTAIMAAWEVMSLMTRIVSRDQIQIVPADAETPGTATHQFFFGSKSHERVAGLLSSFDAKFRFQFGAEWVLTDTEFNREYRLPDPSQLPSGEYEKHTDYGIIEKIVDASGKRVFFVIAGLGDRATRGCARYLVDNWSDILKVHSQGEFRMILEFPGSLEFHHGKLVNREKGGKPVQTQDAGSKE